MWRRWVKGTARHFTGSYHNESKICMSVARWETTPAVHLQHVACYSHSKCSWATGVTCQTMWSEAGGDASNVAPAAISWALAPGRLTSTHWMRYVPLFVEIKAEACEDQGEERHEDSDGDGAAVGGAAGVGVDERYIFPHAQTWWWETLGSVRSSV